MSFFSEQIIRAIWTIFLKMANLYRRFILFFISIIFISIDKETVDFLSNIENEYINISKHKKINMKTFSNVNYNFNTAYLRIIMENVIFKDDLKTSLIAGGYFSNYGQNNLTLEFDRLYSILNKQKDVDIYIETNQITKYIQKYNRKVFKNVKKYPLSFYTLKLVWKGININLIFSDKIMDMINNFDFDFCKIYYSYQKNSIYAHFRLFECFDQINKNFNLKISSNYLNFYEKNLSQQMIKFNRLKSPAHHFSSNFFRYKLIRYVKYAFKGFYEIQEEEKINNIIFFYQNILLKFLKE